MLEKTLEKLLLQYLDPYVDGISKEKLHLGVFSGSLKLEDLRVKPEALRLLGVEGYRVRSGGVKLINLEFPMRDLFKGKVRVVIDQIHFEVEQVMDAEAKSQDEIIDEIRDAKRKAIELLTKQMAELVEQQNTRLEDIGMVSKIIRKIINNITIQIRGVKVTFVSSRGLACAAELPDAAVVSTDSTFREMRHNEAVDLTGLSMYKVLRLKDLGVYMSLDGSHGLLEEKNYVLTRTCASLQLAHELDDPADQVLRVSLDIATEALTQIRLIRSQVKFLFGLLNESTEYNNRLMAIMVPPSDEARLFIDTQATIEKYSELYEKFLMEELGGDKLSEAQTQDLDMIEAAFSVRVLAKERLKVRTKVGALNKEIAKKKAAAEAKRLEEERATRGFFGRMFGGRTAAVASEEPTEWMSKEEQEQLLKEIEDNSLVQVIDVPQRVEAGIKIGSWGLDLVDDRWQDDDKHRQVLSANLTDASIGFDLCMKQDYRQQDSAAWKLVVNLNEFQAFHKKEVIIKFESMFDTPARKESRKSVLEARLGDDDVGEASPLRPSSTPKLTRSKSGKATHWLIEYELREDSNVLKLHFEFDPLMLRASPGAMEQILDFIQAEDLAEGGGSFTSQKSEKHLKRQLSQMNVVPLAGKMELQREETLEAMRSVLKRNSAFVKDTAQVVYERIPDKLELDVRIASPIIVVPVDHLGEATFTLGELHLRTPEPAIVECLDLHLELNHTALSAVSLSGEFFSMIEPTPIIADIKYIMKPNGGGQEVDVCVEATSALNISLAPHALAIILAVPTAITSIFAPDYAKAEAGATHGESTTAQAYRGETERFATAYDWDGLQRIQSEVDFSELEVIGAVQEKYAEVTSTPITTHIQVQGQGFSLTLLDAMNPVLRLYLHMLPPGLALTYTSVPDALNFNVEDVLLEVEFLNTRHGCWEPFAERMRLSVDWKGTTVNNAPVTELVLAGKEPLLLNLTPTAVVRVVDMVPQFLASISLDPPQQCALGGSASKAKYRVVNLSDKPVELQFLSPSSETLKTEVSPTGSKWRSLDEFVLRNFAHAVKPHLKGSEWPAEMQPKSAELPLDRAGMIEIEGSGLFAELLVVASYHLIIISAPIRIHNQTDIELSVRFHNETYAQVLEEALEARMVCDGDVLGMPPPDRVEKFQEKVDNHQLLESTDDFCKPEAPEPHVLRLPPNAICSAPVGALVCSRSTNTRRVTISVKPATYKNMFSDAVKFGGDREASAILCKYSQDGHSEKDMYLVGEASWYDETGLRSDEVSAGMTLTSIARITTIALKPALTVLNALPFGFLSCGYVPVKDGQAQDKVRELSNPGIPACKRAYIYNFSGVVQQGVGIKVRIGEEKGAWSDLQELPLAAFLKVGTISKSVGVRSSARGASAGLVIEPSGRHEVRVSCPNWFIDRSSLDGLAIEVHKASPAGQLLPLPSGRSSGGVLEPRITLLPADCTENRCHMVLRNTKNEYCEPAEFVVPESYSVFPWKNRWRNLIFCIQTEDVAYRDVFGAPCQIHVLRPRVVLTNSAAIDLELALDAGEVRKLASEESVDWHWEVKRGEEDAPFNILKFRPHGSSCAWSGKVICGDASAGSTAFCLQSGEVWSVDVTPASGGLAVTFRKGSELVAINTSSTGAKVTIRPAGGETIELPPGAEVPFGWTRPFEADIGRFVDVDIDGQIMKVKDVRVVGKKFVTVKGQKFIIEVTGKGSQTTIKVRDNLPDANENESHTGFFKVSLKLSRLGLSFVEEIPRAEEYLFFDFDLLRIEFTQHKDGAQSIALVISEGNVNCQLPGRVDGSTNQNRKNRQALGMMSTAEQAVIATNVGETERPFVYFAAKLAPTSSSDIVVNSMEISLDTLELSVDQGWLDHLVKFLGLCSPAVQSGFRYDEIVQLANTPITMNFVPPPLPWVLQVDTLKMSQVSLVIYCVLQLGGVSFLPKVWKGIIGVLSFDNRFTLQGACVTLDERVFHNHRGSANDFIGALFTEYRGNFFQSLGSLLGKSSLLNVPKAPLKIGGGALAYMGNTMGVMAGEAGSVLTNLTFDKEYVEKQKQIRANKKIGGVGQGMVEAGKSLASGAEGLLDVFTKPIQGAKKGGIGGFFMGAVSGVTGTIVKPIAAVGQAVQDVGAGVGSALNPDSAELKNRRERLRTRLPRVFFTSRRVFRSWSEFEAQVQCELGGIAEVHEVISLDETRGIVLLLYHTHLITVELPQLVPQVGASGKVVRDSSGLNVGGNVKESFGKMFAQVAKPADLLVSGNSSGPSSFGNSGNSFGNSFGSSASSSFGVDRREVKYEALRDVQYSPAAGSLYLGTHQGGPIQLMLTNLDKEVAREIVEGLQHAAGRGVADWHNLRQAIRKEQRLAAAKRESLCQELGVGERILEVFEVERYHNLTSRWKTPFNPVFDKDAGWRWVDTQGRRHGQLIPMPAGVSDQDYKKNIQEARKPPCELNSIFRMTVDWQIDVNANTDKDGWRYGMNWNSTTWEKKAAWSDGVRKRRWTRKYE